MDPPQGPADFGYMNQTLATARNHLIGVVRGRYASTRRGFTLIEILIVVVILAILAAVAMPQFTNASDETNESSARRLLQIVRYQIAYYETRTKTAPDLLGSQWDDLIQNDYLHHLPVNPFNNYSLIAAAPGAGVGFVWRNSGTGIMQIYLTDSTGTAEWAE